MVSGFGTNGGEMSEDVQEAAQPPTWGPVGPPPETWRDPDRIVALNVKRVRKLRGLSGRELEDRAGLRRKYVSDLEVGRIGPSVSEVVRIALALSVSPLALVVPWHDGEDEQHSMYVEQGTFGVLFPSGADGVKAAVRLWSARIDPVFSPYVNVLEFETTIPHGYTLDDEGDAGTEREVLPDGTVQVPTFLGSGPAEIRDVDGRRFVVFKSGTVLPLDVGGNL